MNKKQQTKPPSISVLKKRKRIRTIIISVFSGIFSIAMLTWTWTNYAKSVAFNKKMLEEVKKTTDAANKIANSDLINEIAKIQTFAKANVWTKNDIKSAYNAS